MVLKRFTYLDLVYIVQAENREMRYRLYLVL